MLLVRDFPHSTLRHSVLRFQPAEIDILIERAWKSLDEAAAKVKAEGLWQAA